MIWKRERKYSGAHRVKEDCAHKLDERVLLTWWCRSRPSWCATRRRNSPPCRVPTSCDIRSRANLTWSAPPWATLSNQARVPQGGEVSYIQKRGMKRKREWWREGEKYRTRELWGCSGVAGCHDDQTVAQPLGLPAPIRLLVSRIYTYTYMIYSYMEKCLVLFYITLHFQVRRRFSLFFFFHVFVIIFSILFSSWFFFFFYFNVRHILWAMMSILFSWIKLE